jgi:DNA replication protein DnaC
MAESGLSPLQKKQTFGNFSVDWYDDPVGVKIIVDQIKGFAGDLISGRACGNLFLHGPVGNGKTHLCCSVANLVLEAGRSVVYFRGPDLLSAMRDEIYGRSDTAGRWEGQRRDRQDGEGRQSGAGVGPGKDLLRRVIQADLFILDDLGDERLTDFAEEQFISIVDQRLNWQKPWMITSHLAGDRFISHYDARLVDRILGESVKLNFKEKSIRFKRATM